jgi:23S rRNA pseudouridine955/2504/2580 synthase
VIAAKNAAALKILNDKLKNREISKYYKCSVYGIIDPKQGTLKGFLTKCDNNIVKITGKPLNQESSQIITAYQTIRHDDKTSELEVQLITGKTHQIRAHFAAIGHPLVGERKYTTKKYSHLNDKQYQDLTSYKVVFDFKTDAGILNYLKNKSFTI